MCLTPPPLFSRCQSDMFDPGGPQGTTGQPRETRPRPPGDTRDPGHPRGACRPGAPGQNPGKPAPTRGGALGTCSPSMDPLSSPDGLVGAWKTPFLDPPCSGKQGGSKIGRILWNSTTFVPPRGLFRGAPGGLKNCSSASSDGEEQEEEDMIIIEGLVERDCLQKRCQQSCIIELCL